jgi:type II secretory pathway pseudopilin PulG
MQRLKSDSRPGIDLRRGFTSVELAAVGTIIAVLMVFVLPAIADRREAGRLTVCQNNLFNLSHAAQRHADRHGFVPGWRNDGPAAGGFSSWPIALLPFLERNDVYNMISRGDPAPAIFVSTFNCPASPQTAPTLAYAGNCGSGSNLRRADGVMLDTTIKNGKAAGRLALKDIADHDGTASTLLFSEKSGRGTAADALVQAKWSDAIPLEAGEKIPGFSAGASMYAVFGITGTPPARQRIINSVTADAPGFFSQPSSNHPDVAAVAFCDGRVGFLHDTLDGRVYAQLLSWDDKACRASARLYSTYVTWTAGYETLKKSDYIQEVRAIQEVSASDDNLRQIALVMQQYVYNHNRFPSAAICDRDGKPLLSWRVAILPFIDQGELYNQFHLDEPWDSEHNKQFLEKMPKIFLSTGQDGAKPGMTRYVVPTGKGTAFPSPDKATKVVDFTDGMSNTINLVAAEPGKAVPWTKPDDLAIDLEKPHAGLKDSGPGGFWAAFSDGRLQLIPADIAADVLAALFTPAGGEPDHAVE